MVHCSVPFCVSDSSKREPISFHEYPAELGLRNKWLRAVRRKDEYSSNYWQPGDRATVCSKHFLPSDFKMGLKYRRLVHGAVPNVFVGYPDYKSEKPGEKALNLWLLA